jgi:hypothetical protein
MLPGEGDQVRLLARAVGEDGTEPDDPGDPEAGEPAPDVRQDITDPATGLSRLLSERCPTCILRAGDPMHLGPDRTAAFIRHVLDTGSYVVCHDTLTYGDIQALLRPMQHSAVSGKGLNWPDVDMCWGRDTR